MPELVHFHDNFAWPNYTNIMKRNPIKYYCSIFYFLKSPLMLEFEHSPNPPWLQHHSHSTHIFLFRELSIHGDSRSYSLTSSLYKLFASLLLFQSDCSLFSLRVCWERFYLYSSLSAKMLLWKPSSIIKCYKSSSFVTKISSTYITSKLGGYHQTYFQSG